MLQSEIKTLPANSGEIYRIQCVRFDNWREIDFFSPKSSPLAFGRICNLYAEFIVPRAPYIFGQLALFRLPEKLDADISHAQGGCEYADTVSAAAHILRDGVRIIKGRPKFKTAEAKALWQELEEKDCLRVVCGRLPHTKILPVGDNFGFMSESFKDAKLKANASFFTMDCFDCASPYDTLGTPFGLRVKDGIVLSPPLFGREALAVGMDGSVCVTVPRLESLYASIGGKTYRCGENAAFYSRPERRVLPFGRGFDNIIIGQRVTAVKEAGRTSVPASGFILRCADALPVGGEVRYGGMEDVLFAVQVGNSIVRNGEKTLGFISRFYNIRRPFSTEFPPSLYPLDYEGARAPRMAIGADISGRPMLAWFEGMGKFGHVAGEEGCGASLSEMAELCSLLGMHNAVNLDGGGSAQILIDNRRALRISDRSRTDFSEQERAIPSGLIIR